MDRNAAAGPPAAHRRSPIIHPRFAQAAGQAMAPEQLDGPLHGFDAALG